MGIKYENWKCDMKNVNEERYIKLDMDVLIIEMKTEQFKTDSLPGP